ncbi:MAG: hypothetical protein KatS3mg125_0793 [Lysobacterales bacterium]|jgi:thiol:disulfide interchange protein DsbC|nr:MAG: hypothetical protein KatS3mg125_0793 [Xanthomonadales bacterium]
MHCALRPTVLLLALLAKPLSAEEDRVRQGIRALVPDANIESVKPSPVPGLYEVIVSGQIVYVSADGRYLIQGGMFDMEKREDLTELARARIRKEALAKVPPEKRIVFAPKERKHTLTVFTDIDCGYCRRLHQHMAEYNAAGIAIEYLFFPRAGIGSPSYEKAVSVWCSADPRDALTRAKAGEEIPSRSCDNPVMEDFELGKRIGITGTPAVITEEGILIGGYLTPEQLQERLAQLGKR